MRPADTYIAERCLMSNLDPAIFVPVLVGAILILVLSIISIVVKQMKAKLMAEVALRFDPEHVIHGPEMVNFLGLKSEGMGQVRGNGVLILSREGLWFKRGAPEREYTIPLGSIQQLSTPKWFLGKSKGRKMLCVHFSGPAGADEIAFLARDLNVWIEKIEGVRGRS